MDGGVPVSDKRVIYRYLCTLNVCLRARRDERHCEKDADSSLAKRFDFLKIKPLGEQDPRAKNFVL